MRHFHRILTASLAVLLFAGLAAAQQKPKPAEETIQNVPVKVKVVLSEYAGRKEINNLPYTLAVNALGGPQERARTDARSEATHLRMGVRVPIATGAFNAGSGALASNQFQYQDVGTNIDCWAVKLPDSTYQLNMGITRSSVYQPSSGKALGATVASGNPAILNFSVSNTLILRDGQTDESTVASDPVSGHLLRVSVTLHVVKAPGK